MELKDSGVVFFPDTHRYFLGERELHGITGMLSRQIFPNEYIGVNESVLQSAAYRGSNIHQSCQLFDTMGITDCHEAENYARITQHLNHEASEYIVTDREYFASAIDKVYRTGEDTFTLADIKTTYKLNKEKVRWQLSIYAYLFEMQNEGAKVDALFAIWLRTDASRDIAELVPVERIDNEQIIALLEAEKHGQQFPNPYTMPAEVCRLQESIIDRLERLKQLEAEVKELREGLYDRMTETKVKSWEGDLLKITRKDASVSTGFDHKRMRKEHPELADLFAQYETKTERKGNLVITIR